MQPIIGNNQALFINDAYNAAPTSMAAALTFLKETTLRNEKWVVLGDMLELGDEERAYHEQLLKPLVEIGLTGIALFGPRMKWLYDKLQDQVGEATLLWSENNYTPIQELLLQKTNEKSVVLLKGSRGMAIENVMGPLLDEEK